MDLPPQILANYQKHFREVRAQAGSDLHSVLGHYGHRHPKLWLLLDRIVDWRSRSGEPWHLADRFVVAFRSLHCDVQNGGFSQYFANTAGDSWQDLLQVLVLGHDSTSENHFRRVLAAFPESQPSVDRKIRNHQLSEIENTDPDWDRALNDEYYGSVSYPTDETVFRALSAIEDADYVPNPDRP